MQRDSFYSLIAYGVGWWGFNMRFGVKSPRFSRLAATPSRRRYVRAILLCWPRSDEWLGTGSRLMWDGICGYPVCHSPGDRPLSTWRWMTTCEFVTCWGLMAVAGRFRMSLVSLEVNLLIGLLLSWSLSTGTRTWGYGHHLLSNQNMALCSIFLCSIMRPAVLHSRDPTTPLPCRMLKLL